MFYRNRMLYICFLQPAFIFLFFLNFILFFNFTLLYWFCHISKWIRHRCNLLLKTKTYLWTYMQTKFSYKWMNTSCCKRRSLKSERTKYEIISDPLKKWWHCNPIFIYNIYIHTSSGNFLKVIQICLGSRNF